MTTSVIGSKLVYCMDTLMSEMSYVANCQVGPVSQAPFKYGDTVLAGDGRSAVGVPLNQPQLLAIDTRPPKTVRKRSTFMGAVMRTFVDVPVVTPIKSRA